MPNSIKYNTSTETEALNHGDFWMGVGDVGKGPTSTTGYWNGINSPSGGYTIYVHKSSEGPSIQLASDDAELISITNKIAGTSYTTINECFNYFDGQSGKMVTHQTLNFRVTDGLVLDLDAGVIPSYPQNGTTWNDLSGGGNDSTLINSPTFNNGVFNLNTGGSNSERIEIPKPSQLATDQYLTIEILFKLNTLPTVAYGDDSPILGARIGSDYMIFAYPASNNKSHLGVSYDDSRYNAAHESVFETEAGQWVQFTHVGIPYEQSGYQRGKLMYYINGILDRDEFISSDSNGWGIPNPFYGGYDARHLKYSDISIAKIRMYDRQLTPQEISQNYYQAPIVTDGLIRALDFSNLISYESGSSSGYDLTGNDTFDLINDPLYTSDFGGGLVCDATDDFIVLADKTPSNYVSAECWFRNDSNDSTENIIFNKESSWEVKEQNGILQWALYTSNQSWFWSNANVSIDEGEMCHIVLTYDGNYVKFYFNGVETVSYTYPSGGVLNAQDSCYPKLNSRGCTRTSPASLGNKTYCQFRIYDRALTLAEVQQNYNATKSKFL